MKGLSGKVAIVTGGATLIGKAVVERLVSAGESPRVSRRLNTLRGLSHEQVEQVLARGA